LTFESESPQYRDESTVVHIAAVAFEGRISGLQGKIVHGGKNHASKEKSCQEKETLTVRR
jgi:hypothetical protein